jgi:serine phosphatase RsbU (regulator of sigma subunit)
MKLRSRLIVAFLVVSVLPLTMVTLSSYRSSIRAFQRAVEAEASTLAAEMGQRMELVTAELDRRVDELWDSPIARRRREAPEAATGDEGMANAVAPLLGQAAALLDRVEIVTVAPPPAPPGHEAPGAAGRPAPPVPAAAQLPGVPLPPPPPAKIVVDLSKVLARADEMARRSTGNAAAVDRVRQVIEGGLDLGVRGAAIGLRIGADELARLATEKRHIAERWRAAMEDRAVEREVTRAGKVVGKVNARVNVDRMLTAVLSDARRDRGEIPFALDQKRRVYTPRLADRTTLHSLGVAGAPAGSRPDRDWIVVTRRDPSGVTFGIARPVGDALAEIRRTAGRNLGIGLGVIGLALIGIVPLSGRMTRNLTSLTEGVRRLATGDFTARVPVRSRDEFGQLAASFNQMAKDLEANQTLVVTQERLQRELELCRQIQTEMLPHEPLRLGFAEVRGVSIPAREVGGDFFNYFALDGGQIALVVGDVSGKGVGAALLMANIQATLRARLPLEQDLARLVDALDGEIERTTPRGVFCTLFLGILDTASRTLRYVNAGHNPQFVLRASGGLERMGATGLPVGLFAGHGFEERNLALADGDFLFFYTDGAVETENDGGESFGADRLEALLLAEHGRGIDDVLAGVEGAVRRFRGQAEPLDDATMMALKLALAPEPAVV